MCAAILYTPPFCGSGRRSALFFVLYFFVAIGPAQNRIAGLGDSCYKKGLYPQAARYYEQAAAADEKFRATWYYNAACSRALSGSNDSAFINLRHSVLNGWNDAEGLKADTDLARLHYLPEWKKFLGEMEYQNDKQMSLYMWGMFFGILFILFFYNLLLYFSMREKAYLWYALSIFFYANFEYYRTADFGRQLTEIFFWYKYFQVPGHGMTFINLFMVTFLFFCRDFLNVKAIVPGAVKWLNGFILLFSVASIVLPLFAGVPLRVYLYSLVLVSYLFIFVLGIICWRRKYRPARYFVVATGVLLLGVYAIILSDFEIIPFKIRIGVFRGDNLGSIGFYAILSLALGDKMNLLKKEKEEAQDKALLVLEEKVKERTREVVEQKELIEEKQKEILDSIRYARRIQRALITNEKYIDRSLRRLHPVKA